MKNIRYFIALSLISIITSLISKYILNTEELIVNTLMEYFSLKEIEDELVVQRNWQWLTYGFITVLTLIKVTIIASILDIGCFFFGKQIKYKKLFNIVVKAEFFFLLVIIFKTAWFYFFQTDYNLEDLQYFYPLSALNIVGYEGLQPWFIYPVQVFNLFELAYWVILAYLIDKELNENTVKGMSIVASSYGVSLLIWVVGVMFFTLNMS
ncbi:MAG: hypothetical protein COZ16_12220 [Flavobacteriaceae bacterium CG_4_10_14_3_um_filter_31_253]|nr:MAG: hypothetical protein COW43_02255 [Flavobacteriaceae bacterium CG17_big_fil_post_rev_8_21_14_2_50_31_13]PIX12346.1 MAG: hypothetical protein COZ74_11610 [Flavobacteriaceae bacterium CG_4_8_14_3_um_filter_31_8]PIY13851.1 MAG: hypothetical protein COZ16_12220 [Flavobacteriaceae bacterium CG_4_10_14_3_um_filter_31_253]PIZ09559.1 MAG: hypothetical protein COY55_12195 [Flavobacteriaceae bacterium CG_4_10_14_0_8_um_filter_31_99]PJC10107.1 MAG: hypothetical protein CO067_06385 [Flavobacteriacea